MLRKIQRNLRDHLEAIPAQLLADRDRWFYWAPVGLALGIGFYFLPANEPWRWLGLCALLPLLGLSWLARGRELLFVGLVALTLVAAGFTATQLRSYRVAAPMLSEKLGPVMVSGIVSAREVGTDSGRVVLTDLQIDRLKPEQTPRMIRLTFRAALPLPVVGTAVKVLANLLPPMEPAYPGAYNFRREAFFKGIGAYGMALTAAEVQGEQKPVSWAEQAREHMLAHVTATIPGPEGAIAAALMTGERGAIDDKTNADMRAAGTTHLLSISGMHIGMVGGIVFFLIRALLALVPAFALRWPLKRIAAIAALSAVIGYTWFVGAPIPAQRAALMTALVFLAILLDRQAITLRTVALAAGVILLLFPEALLNPGFQMSFGAIVMLVSAYEWWAVRRGEGAPSGFIKRSWLYLAGIVVTSVIAGLATMPYGVWHFHYLQLLGVLGNLIAVPLTGIIVMPAMVVAYVLQPLNLADLPLWVMGAGLQGVTQSAAWIAAMPYATVIVGQLNLAGLLLVTFGGLWLALWKSRLRFAGVLLVLLGCFVLPLTAQPVAMVHAEGRVAVRGTDGALYVKRAPAKGMVLEQWSLAFAKGRAVGNWRSPEAQMKCDVLGCIYNGWLAMPAQLLAGLEDCSRAKVIVATDMRLRKCEAPLVIDRQYLRTHGSVLLYENGTAQSVRQPGRSRMWEPLP